MSEQIRRTSVRPSPKRQRGASAAPTTLGECAKCPALCCHDFVQPIDKPKTDDDIFELKWELQYDTIRVFIRSRRWYRIVAGRCLYLDDDDRCTIYERRPKRCRQLGPPECEARGDFFEVMISTPEELNEHLARSKSRRKK